MEVTAITNDLPASSLGQLLQILEAADNGLVELDTDSAREILTRLNVKVDCYKYLLEKYEAEIKRVADRQKEYQDLRRVLENKRDSIKSMMAYFMASNNFTSVPGQEWVAKLRETESVKVLTDANQDTFIKYFQFHRVKYEWDKEKIKDYIRAGNSFECAILETKPSVRFELKKQEV